MYVDEVTTRTIPRSAVSDCVTALTHLISGAWPYARAAAVCLDNLNTVEPALRIQTILSIAGGSETPPPPMPKNLSRRCRLWTQDDDVRLLAGIHRHGLGDWKRIAQFVGHNKSSSQCSQRWSRAINPSLRKEQWTVHEDEDLWELVKRIGQHSWAKVAQHMKSRSDVQCRYRFEQLKKVRRFGEPPPTGTELKFMQNPFEGPVEDLVAPLVIRGPRPAAFF
jgi:hypothetical protein